LLLIAQPGQAQDAKAAMEDAAGSWEAAFNAGDGKAVAELYTEDAALFPPGAERVDGNSVIAEFWQGAVADPRRPAASTSSSGSTPTTAHGGCTATSGT
jgi:ketosteroid isomerase-like protein